jgi:uncharacterized protein
LRFPEKPTPQNYFVDRAGLIEPAAQQAVNATAAAQLREHDVPIVVVTIGSLSEMQAASSSIEDYATALFNHWGIGSSERNLGILLLVSVGDRKARIELGAAWESDRDLQAANIMESLIIPAFKRGDYSTGIADGVRGLDAMVRGLNLPPPTRPWWHRPAMAMGALFVVGAIVSLFRSGNSGWAWAGIAGVSWLLYSVVRNAGQTRSTGRGGSGGGFRGGSSRGGGATGSW